jgi:hypothetical protein
VHVFKYIDEIDDSENIVENRQNPNGSYRYSRNSCFKFNAKQVMIGESPLNAMTRFSGGHGPKFRGNSILLEETEKEAWVWIGDSILRFKPFAPIVEFISPVGNNDVPYPWARDEDGNTYLFTEDVILSPECKWEDNDPYRYYYDHQLMTTDLGVIPPDEPLYPPVRGITKWKVGEDQYTLRCAVCAGQNWDRIMDWNEGDLIFEYEDGTEKVISREEYIEIMEEVSRERGFSKFKNTVLMNRIW